MPVRHFTDLEVVCRSHKLFTDLVVDVNAMQTKRGAMILADQVLRSVGSIGANIAEGFNRSKKKYLNSLDIALGEAAESENWLYKFRDTGYLKQASATDRIRDTIEIQKMLNGLLRSIRRSNPDT